jgi:hypothetical protein
MEFRKMFDRILYFVGMVLVVGMVIMFPLAVYEGYKVQCLQQEYLVGKKDIRELPYSDLVMWSDKGGFSVSAIEQMCRDEIKRRYR